DRAGGGPGRGRAGAGAHDRGERPAVGTGGQGDGVRLRRAGPRAGLGGGGAALPDRLPERGRPGGAEGVRRAAEAAVEGPVTEGPRAARRRGLILSSARELLRRDGWHAVGIDEIGEAAGVSGPAVYRYFGTKQEVLTEALRYAAEQLWSSEPAD